MKIKLLLSCLFVLTIVFNFETFSQTNTFQKVYYGPDMGSNAAVKSQDGGCIIAGACNYEAFAMKIDSLGNFVWSMQEGNSGNERYTCITATSDSCFVMAGVASNLGSSTNGLLITKIDANGNVIWNSGIQYNIEVTSIHETSDRGFVLCGNNSSVLKLDSLGNNVWASSFIAGNNSNYANEVKQTSDGGFLWIGYAENFPPYEGNAVLVKIDSTGTETWSKKFNLLVPDVCVGLNFQILSDGYLCLLSVTNRMVILKTDFNGNVNWSKSFYSLFAGSCLNCGKARLNWTLDYNFVISLGGAFFPGSELYKIDSLGNILWEQQVYLENRDVVVANDNGYFVIGNGPLQGLRTMAPVGPHIGVEKTDSTGSGTSCNFQLTNLSQVDSVVSDILSVITVTAVAPPMSFTLPLITQAITIDPGCVPILGGITGINAENNFTIFPNPVSEKINFSFGQHSGKYVLSIYSSLGRLVYSCTVNEYESLFSIDEKFAAGIYNVVVRGDDFEFSKKLLIK